MTNNVWLYTKEVQEKFQFRYPLSDYSLLEHRYIPEMLHDTLPKSEISVTRRLFSLKTLGVLALIFLMVDFAVETAHEILAMRVTAWILIVVMALICWVLLDSIFRAPLKLNPFGACGEITDYCAVASNDSSRGRRWRILVYLIEFPEQEKCVLYSESFHYGYKLPWKTYEEFDRKKAIPVGTKVLMYHNNLSDKIVRLSEEQADLMQNAPILSKEEEKQIENKSILYQ